jgi:eukaryotic-like serine/threonine-protein kinase
LLVLWSIVGSNPANPLRVVGRYALYAELASGGMATVHFGRLMGPVGFARTVAIKRLHPQYAKDPEFVSMFLDEARLAARIQHPNVAATLDVVATQGELFLVMEYLQGETLSRLMRAARDMNTAIDPRVVSTILSGSLHGLHAAHEAKNERGEALGIVHRDISPQNILVGQDGVPRVLDFGVAKAAGRFHTTREGNVKGKLPYMSPEQLRGGEVDRTTDTYAAAVVLWEALTCRKLFRGENEGSVLEAVLFGTIEPPSTHVPHITPELDALVLKGLDRDKSKRFQTAREFALALERCVAPALASDVGEWVHRVAGSVLTQRAEKIAEIESFSNTGDQPMVTEVMQGLADTNQPPAPPASTSTPAIGDPSSQVSSISVAAQSRPPPEKRRGLMIGLLGVGAAIALLLVGLLVGLSHSNDRNVGSATPTASTASSAPPTATTTATVEATPPSTGTPTVAAVASSATPIKSATATNNKPPVVTRPTATTKQDDCNPPFKIGPNGLKIYKPECIK